MNRKLLTVAITGALGVPHVADAIPFAIAGQVNRAVMAADDGIASDVLHVDNGVSRSRVTITGSDNLGVASMTAGVRLEWSVASNVSSNVTIKGRNGNTAGTDIAFDVRHSSLWFSGNFGRLTLGHTSGAADGMMEADQSGDVGLGGIVNAALSFGGAIGWRTKGGGALGASLARTGSDFDGGRYDLVRYDTPAFGPLRAGVAVGDNQRWDASAQVEASFAGAKIVLAGGYEDRSKDAGFDQWALSASVLFAQGTNVTLAYGERDIEIFNATTVNGPGTTLRDAAQLYVKLGHRWGTNSVAIDFKQIDDLAAPNDEHTTWGIGFGHALPGPNVQLYASYRNHDLDRPGANVEDVDVYALGARVRF